jgi:hypothetical protein
VGLRGSLFLPEQMIQFGLTRRLVLAFVQDELLGFRLERLSKGGLYAGPTHLGPNSVRVSEYQALHEFDFNAHAVALELLVQPCSVKTTDCAVPQTSRFDYRNPASGTAFNNSGRFKGNTLAVDK